MVTAAVRKNGNSTVQMHLGYTPCMEKEIQLRTECVESGNYMPLITSNIEFSMVFENDLEVISEFGYDLDTVYKSYKSVNEIVRLAAEIREFGDIRMCEKYWEGSFYEGRHLDGVCECVVDPLDMPLDEDGNYPEGGEQ